MNTFGECRCGAVHVEPRITSRDCGTRMFIDVLALGLRGVNGYLLSAGQFHAQFHMQWCRDAPSRCP
jgi:hypothetical protein